MPASRADMKVHVSTIAAVLLSLLATTLAAQRGGAGQGAREVTVTAIPGVVAAGATWSTAWQGTDNADGLVGTPDGGLLFAQEQPRRISKLDAMDRASVFLSDTHGVGSIGIDSKGRVIAVERTCTDPGGHPESCNEPTAVSVLTPTRARPRRSLRGQASRTTQRSRRGRKGRRLLHGRRCVLRWRRVAVIKSLGEDLRTNGVMLSRDEKIVYVTNGNVIVAFDILPDGSVTNRRNFATLEAGGNGDGMAIDGEGRLVCHVRAGRAGLQLGRQVSRPDPDASQCHQRCVLRSRQANALHRRQRRARTGRTGVHDARWREEQRENDLPASDDRRRFQRTTEVDQLTGFGRASRTSSGA